MTPAGLMTWGLMTAQPKLRSVTQIMATARNLPAEAQVPAKQLDPGTTEVVNALFKELQAIFPAWKQAWPDDEALKAAKRSWIKSFVAAGINTLEQIRFGIQKCRVLGTDFAPSSGKFIKLCQPTPEEMGIPPLARALAEALENFHPSRAGSRTVARSSAPRGPAVRSAEPGVDGGGAGREGVRPGLRHHDPHAGGRRAFGRNRHRHWP